MYPQNNESPKTTTLLEETTKAVAQIVSAVVSNPQYRPEAAGVTGLIEDVRAALTREQNAGAPPVDLKPAVPIKKSVTPDFIICLEDGMKFKSLKRHISTLGMTPDQYREKWGLPGDYPMVAPNYANARSELAKKMGLGKRREPEPVAKVAAKKGGKAKANAPVA